MPADPCTGDFPASILTEEEVVCHGCGQRWTVEVREEYGLRHWARRWLVNNDDLICPMCGTQAD